MIETRENIKTMVGISGTSKDSIIDMLLPILEREIHEHTRNNFVYNYNEIYLHSSAISFDKDNNKISDLASGFGDFQDGMTIKVFHSKLNNGVYTIQSANSAYLELSSTYGSLKFNESTGNSISIYRVEYPDNLKLTFAKMLKFKLDYDYNFKKEKIDDYEIEFENSNFKYPANICSDLKMYKQVYKDRV